MAFNGSMSFENGMRFVTQVESSFQEDAELITDLAVVPVLKVLSMGALGTILAHPKVSVINPETTKLLSKLVFALFLPCLIFTELGAAVTFDNMMAWWFIPVNVVLSTVIGCLVGVLVAVVCRPPPQFFRFVVVMTGAGVAYVAFSTWIGVIIIYTFVYHMLEPPEYEVVPALDGAKGGDGDGDGEGDEESDEEVQLLANGETNVGDEEEGKAAYPSVLEAEWPGLRSVSEQNEYYREPVLRQLWRGISLASQVSVLSDDEELTRKVRCMKEPKMVRRLRGVAKRTPLQHMFQPPTVASFLAIAVGLFPNSKAVLFGIDAPLGFVDDSFDILATAMVPCIMLVLGGSLAGGPGKSELGLKTTIGVCVARLLLVPLIGIGVVQGAEYMGYFPVGDRMFKFVLLMHYSMPTAILCGAMASLRGHGEAEAGALMFWQHIMAVFTVTFYMAIYLNLVTYV
ncbi:hypothetical protein R1sor_012711 [Riccia sorocarpa]|uniref:PIN-like protein n=1 Tax=Riccia sorocarpa TaxID=122646 RepID=A0ABD3I855_9MARC